MIGCSSAWGPQEPPPPPIDHNSRLAALQQQHCACRVVFGAAARCTPPPARRRPLLCTCGGAGPPCTGDSPATQTHTPPQQPRGRGLQRGQGIQGRASLTGGAAGAQSAVPHGAMCSGSISTHMCTEVVHGQVCWQQAGRVCQGWSASCSLFVAEMEWYHALTKLVLQNGKSPWPGDHHPWWWWRWVCGPAG